MDNQRIQDIYYFSSTHWDREWYQSFQGFRYRLVQMVDKLLDLFENDPDYQVFHFDGQSIVLADYAQIRPEKVKQLEELLRRGKILAGPWYVMPDEFLVSGESLIRNLAKGHQLVRQWGGTPWKFGYICDIFGHIAQMPQIFNGFSISCALLGRGTNEDDDAFFIWRAPDGSECITFKVQEENGYGSFRADVYDSSRFRETTPKTETERLRKHVEDEMKRTNLPIVILMDGLDHSEACPQTTQYLRTLRQMYPNAQVHHCDLKDAMDEAKKYSGCLKTIFGELNRTARDVHGYLHLISNTLSSYYPLKQENDFCQNLIEKQIEPLLYISQFEGIPLNRSFLELAYEYLLKNHPHDSICGCSIDCVHQNMEYRFSQARELCSALREDYFRHKLELSDQGTGAHCLTLYNSLAFSRRETVTVDLNFPTDYKARFAERFGYEEKNCFKILDCNGNEIPYQLTRIQRNMEKRLYDQVSKRFDIHTVSFTAELPPCGTVQYKIVPSAAPVRYFQKMKSDFRSAENKWLRLEIASDGTLTLTDKLSGHTMSGLGVLADDGEIGDGWFHVNPVNDRTILSQGSNCTIEKIEDGPGRCVFRVTRAMEVPSEMIWSANDIHRSDETIPLRIVTEIGLSEHAKHADITLYCDNTAKDHRLRLLFPTDTDGDTYFAGQAFCCVTRKTGINTETQSWSEPEPHEKQMNGIFGKRGSDGNGFAFVSAAGLHECAAYRDRDSTLSVTLLRGFRKTMLTNGETNCQLNRLLTYRFALVPLNQDIKYPDLVRLQDSMASDPSHTFYDMDVKNHIALPQSFLELKGDNLLLSIIKCAESGEAGTCIVRIYNPTDDTAAGELCFSRDIMRAELVNLNEEFEEQIAFSAKSIRLTLLPWKIQTLKITLPLQ